MPNIHRLIAVFHERSKQNHKTIMCLAFVLLMAIIFHLWRCSHGRQAPVNFHSGLSERYASDNNRAKKSDLSELISFSAESQVWWKRIQCSRRESSPLGERSKELSQDRSSNDRWVSFHTHLSAYQGVSLLTQRAWDRFVLKRLKVLRSDYL